MKRNGEASMLSVQALEVHTCTQVNTLCYAKQYTKLMLQVLTATMQVKACLAIQHWLLILIDICKAF